MVEGAQFHGWFGQTEFQLESAAKQSRVMFIMGFNEAENWCCPLHQRGFQLQENAKIFITKWAQKYLSTYYLSTYWALPNFSQLCQPQRKAWQCCPEQWALAIGFAPQWQHSGQGLQPSGTLAHSLVLARLGRPWALLTAPPVFPCIWLLLGHRQWLQHGTASSFSTGCQQTCPSMTCWLKFLLPWDAFTRGCSKG